MRARWWALALVLAAPGAAHATPPPPDPVTVRLHRDLRGVDLEDCHGLARRLRRFLIVEVIGSYEQKRRPRFEVRPHYGAPRAAVACVQERFTRYQATAPRHEPDSYGAPRDPSFKAYRWLTLGERRHILPPAPRVVTAMRGPADPSGARRTLGPGIALAGGRCLITTSASDDVTHAFYKWLEDGFPHKLPLNEDDLSEAQRFRVDDRWLLDVRIDVAGGPVACLVPTGELEHHLGQVREQLHLWGLLEDLDRQSIHVAWTVDRAHRARHVDSCVGPPGSRGRRAPAAAVAKLRAELAKLLAGKPLPGTRPGDTFVATMGPWQGFSLRRVAGGPPALPSDCLR